MVPPLSHRLPHSSVSYHNNRLPECSSRHQCLLGLLASINQAEAKDIIQGVCEVNTVKAALLDVQDNIEVHHTE